MGDGCFDIAVVGDVARVCLRLSTRLPDFRGNRADFRRAACKE